MIVEVKVPVFAESIQEGTVLAWQRQPGDTVRKGDHLVDIETDKVVLEIVAPADGVLRQVLKPRGEVVASEELIATVDTEYGAEERPFETEPPQVMPLPAPVTAAAPPARLTPEGLTPAAGTRPQGPAPTPVTGAQPEVPTLAPPPGPAVRRLLAEHGLGGVAIPGTGPDGRVTRADVLAHVESQAVPKPPPLRAAAPAAPGDTASVSVPAPRAPAGHRAERREPLTRIRARIAQRLVEAQHQAALLTTFNEINMQPVVELRNRHRERFEKAHGVRLGFMSFFARAAVEALKRFPAVNAYLEPDAVVFHDYYDVGIAVGSPRGLVVPVLRDVDRLSFAEVERAIAGFAERAKDGRLKPEDLVGGTFTITNGGVFGSLLSTPIVNPPQSAILGMHKVEDRPVAENGQVVIRPMMYVALTYDHRLVDGRDAVQFLVAVKEAVEDPARMLLGV